MNAARIGDQILQDAPHCHAPIHPAAPVPTPTPHPAMPLAILRHTAQELPIAYALDDSLAMAPGMGISSQPRVVITARISRSGNARPQPGDLQGASAPVANDAAGVDVLIDSVVR